MLSPQGLGEGAEKGAGDGQPPSHAGERRSTRGGCRGLPEPVLATSGTRWVAPPWLSHTRGMGDPFPWVRGGRGLQEQQQLFLLLTGSSMPGDGQDMAVTPCHRQRGPWSPSSPPSPRTHHDGCSGVVYFKQRKRGLEKKKANKTRQAPGPPGLKPQETRHWVRECFQGLPGPRGTSWPPAPWASPIPGSRTWPPPCRAPLGLLLSAQPVAGGPEIQRSTLCEGLCKPKPPLPPPRSRLCGCCQGH